MIESRIQQLEHCYMNIAEEISSMSVANRSKVGAILVKNGNIISMGWNGMPSGLPNEEIEFLQPDGSLVTNDLVLHAESNAILKCAKHGGISSEGSTLYNTMSPCIHCAKLIIQAGIVRVVFRNLYRDPSSLEIFKRTSIEVVHLKR